jgi:ATP-dependent Zn protease
MPPEKELEYEMQKAVAHHEAAHIVLAAVHGMVLMKDGIYIDNRGGGISCDRDVAPGGIRTHREQRASMVVCYAGRHAHVKQYHSEEGCWFQDDVTKARKHAEAMNPDDRDALSECMGMACKEAEKLVKEYWPVIDAVATALVKKEFKNEENDKVKKYGLANPVG